MIESVNLKSWTVSFLIKIKKSDLRMFKKIFKNDKKQRVEYLEKYKNADWYKCRILS